MKKIFIIFLLIITYSVFANDAYVDSLEAKLTPKDYRRNYDIFMLLAKHEIKQNPDQPSKYAEKAINTASYLDSKKHGKTLYIIAYYYKLQEQYEIAEDYFNRSLIISKKNQDSELIAKNYNQLGNILRYKSSFGKAQNYFILALEIFQNNNNYPLMVATYSYMANCFKELEDYTSALNILLKAEKVLTVHKDDKKLAVILNSIGTIYKRLRQLDEAHKFYLRSLTLCEQENEKLMIVKVRANVATLLLLEERYQEATNEFLKLLEYVESFDRAKSMTYVQIYNSLCEGYTGIGNYDKAEEYALKAIELALEKEYINSLKVTYNNLSTAYYKAGRYEEALVYLNKCFDLHTQIVNETIFINTKEMEVKYNTAEKEKQIIILKKENEIRRQRFVSLIALSILLIIIIMLVSFLYHLKLMTNKKLKNEISERKKTELQLADSEKLLKLVIDSIPAHIFLKNKDYKYVMVNKTMKDYYQLLDEDFINHDLFDILQKFPTLNEVFNKCIYNDILVIEEKDNREITMEVMNPHDTSKQWFNSKTKYIEFGQQDHILGVSLDITPLKLAQKKLENINSSLETIVSKRTKQLMGTNKKLKLEIFERIKIERKLAHSELQYRTLLHNIPQRIFYKDLNSIYQLCNKSFADEVGKSIEEIFEKNDYDLFEKDVAKNFIENDKKVLSTMKIMEFDERYLKNDTECIVHTVKAPIRDENGDVIGLLGIFWDVTAQRKAEQQILYSERISGIGEMAGGVAHEIKNPLSNISSAIQLLEEDIETNEEISSLIKIIHDSVTDASDTISKLISFASPQELTLKDGDLWQIMKHTLTLLKGNFTQSNIKLTSHKTGEFPIIKVDEVHMKSAIMNIAMNAIQAMPNGGTFDIQGIADKTQIKLIFTDSGCGISKNQLNKIFDPFFTTKKIGSGLGMGLIYSVMKFHSGTIDVKSKVDVGTEITLTFPLI